MKMRVKPRINYVEGREMFDRPDGIIDCAGEIDGFMRSWKEYVPSSYDGSKTVPLVVTLHGGSSTPGKNNHRAELSTAWASVAEREGFIVLYPQSLTPEWAWSAWENFSDKKRTAGLPDDIRYLNQLLELTLKKYQIDTTRMYLHGQSFGDVMGTFYLLNNPEHPYAAAATMSGPVGAERLFEKDGSFRYGEECALPVVRTHGSEDLAIPMGNYQHMNDAVPTFDLMRHMKEQGRSKDEIIHAKLVLHQIPLLENWKHCNGCTGEVQISVRGRYNAITYPGKQDFHFYMVEGGGHGPSMDMADFIWTNFLSGYSRVDGKIVKGEPKQAFVPDEGAVILADGAGKAIVNNQTVELNGKVREIEGSFYVQPECVPQLFPELSVEAGKNEAIIRLGEKEMQVSACNRTFVWCDHLKHGERTLADGDILLIPAAQIAEYFYGCKAKCRDGVCYLSKADGVLTYDFAYLMRQMLGTEPVLTPEEMRAKADEILANVPQPGMKEE